MTDYIAEQEKIDAGVKSYINSFPLPKTLAEAVAERNFWIEEACRFSRSEGYYRDLIDQVAVSLGRDAYTADDGSIYDEPVRAKVPELVAARLGL